MSESSRTTLNRTSTVLESVTVKYSDSFGTACMNHCFTPEYLGFPAIASAKGVSFDRLERSVFFIRIHIKKKRTSITRQLLKSMTEAVQAGGLRTLSGQSIRKYFNMNVGFYTLQLKGCFLQ